MTINVIQRVSAHVKLAHFVPECPTHINMDEVTLLPLSHRNKGAEKSPFAAQVIPSLRQSAITQQWRRKHLHAIGLLSSGRTFVLHTYQHALKQLLGSESACKTNKFIC